MIFIFLKNVARYAYNYKSMKCGLGSDEDSKKHRKISMYVETIIPIGLILLTYIYIFIKVRNKKYSLSI